MGALDAEGLRGGLQIQNHCSNRNQTPVVDERYCLPFLTCLAVNCLNWGFADAEKAAA